MKPKQIFLIVIALVVLGVIAARVLPERRFFRTTVETAPTSTPPLNPALPPQAAAVLFMDEGAATLVRNGERYVAHDGLELKPGDQLDVGEADVEIIWPHYGRTILASGSVVQFQKAFESTNRERLELKLLLERGRMWTKLYDTLFQGQTFQIRLGSILLDASGGSFGVTREENGDALIDVRGQALRALTVRDEVPTGEMRKEGFNEMFVEVAVTKTEEIGGRALLLSQDGSTSPADGSSDSFAERGDAALSPDALDVQPTNVTLMSATPL